jgi:hypothetical protein
VSPYGYTPYTPPTEPIAPAPFQPKGDIWDTTTIQSSNVSVNEFFHQAQPIHTLDAQKQAQIKAIHDQYDPQIDELQRILTAGGATLWWHNMKGENADVTLARLTKERDDALTAAGSMADITGVAPQIIRDQNGNPIAEGYWHEGTFYLERDLRSVATGLEELRELDMPTLTSWMQEQGLAFGDATEAMQGMQALIAQITDPMTQEGWQQGGLDWAGQLMGLQPGEYQPTMAGMLQGLQGGIQGQQGFTAEEQDLFQRGLHGERMAMREDFAMMVDSLQSSGRDVMAIMKADEAIRTISNTQLQAQAKRVLDNYALKETQWQAQKQQYDTMLQTGVASATEYIQRQREHAMLQLTAVSQEVATMFQQNEQYLMQYQQELVGFQAVASDIYNDIMINLGVDSQLIEQMEGFYNMMLAPMYTQMEQTAFQAELQAQSAEQSMSMWSSVISLIGTGVSALLGNWGAVFGNVAAAATD